MIKLPALPANFQARIDNDCSENCRPPNSQLKIVRFIVHPRPSAFSRVGSVNAGTNDTGAVLRVESPIRDRCGTLRCPDLLTRRNLKCRSLMFGAVERDVVNDGKMSEV